MGLFKLTQNGPSGPYETKYDIEFEKPLTLREFLDEVLKQREWGKISVKDNSIVKYFVGGFSFNPSFCIEYNGDKFITDIKEVFNEQQLNLNVINAYCVSGWSLSDYWITIGS